MRVRDVMTTDVRCCAPDSPLPEVARLMRDGDCGALPVVDQSSAGRVVGIITDRDITIRLLAKDRNALELGVASCMSTPAVTIRADESLATCCQIMEARKIRRLPVVDDTDRCIGIVSQADIARHAPEARTGDLLQEISKPAA